MGRFAMAANGGHILVKRCAVIALAPVVCVFCQRKASQHGGNAADVVEMIVAYKDVIDLLDAKLIEIGHGRLAVLSLHVLAHVKQDDFAARGNEHGPITLADVNMMDLEFAVLWLSERASA